MLPVRRFQVLPLFVLIYFLMPLVGAIIDMYGYSAVFLMALAANQSVVPAEFLDTSVIIYREQKFIVGCPLRKCFSLIPA